MFNFQLLLFFYPVLKFCLIFFLFLWNSFCSKTIVRDRCKWHATIVLHRVPIHFRCKVYSTLRKSPTIPSIILSDRLCFEPVSSICTVCWFTFIWIKQQLYNLWILKFSTTIVRTNEPFATILALPDGWSRAFGKHLRSNRLDTLCEKNWYCVECMRLSRVSIFLSNPLSKKNNCFGALTLRYFNWVTIVWFVSNSAPNTWSCPRSVSILHLPLNSRDSRSHGYATFSLSTGKEQLE